MKKYTPDYESGLMEIDDKYGEYVLTSEHDAEIAMWKKGFHGLELEIAELKYELRQLDRLLNIKVRG